MRPYPVRLPKAYCILAFLTIKLKNTTLTINRLSSRALVPDTDAYQALFSGAIMPESYSSVFGAVQARLSYGLEQLCHPQGFAQFMLVKAPEEADYLGLIGLETRKLVAEGQGLYGGHYDISGNQVTLRSAEALSDNFAAQGEVVIAQWAELEQLFGCVRQFNGSVTLQPGLVHQANGGILVIPLRTLLTQPLMWLRLKQMVVQGRFDWVSPDENRPLPVSIPALPLSLKVILAGDRESLADFQEMEPDLAAHALYAEFEDTLVVDDEESMAQWMLWVNDLALRHQLPTLTADAWPVMVREAVRYSGDQEILPLSPDWLLTQLREANLLIESDTISGEALKQMLAQREWRESYLAERMRDEILQEQILIETEGEQIGQINALSVIEFPGHPRAFGEPSRISCVVHIGDGEFIDVERKAELGGNIHAKGMMIMQAFLMSELDLDQQIPFTASLTFEQSYSEVDGDSASMAELCALISALSGVPIRQNIAVTGSVDQFGRVQPVGGLNEKIEGFFRICEDRGLTKDQGIIIPASNVRHLALHQDILDAIDKEEFKIWAVDDIEDTLPLLTNMVWDGEGRPTLIQAVQERIAQASQQEGRNRYPWPLRWLNWFNHN